MTNSTLPPGLHKDTLAVRAAVDKTQYGENSEALFLTSSFVQPDSETASRRFAGEEDGYIYSRFTNPTVASFEKRLAAGRRRGLHRHGQRHGSGVAAVHGFA